MSLNTDDDGEAQIQDAILSVLTDEPQLTMTVHKKVKAQNSAIRPSLEEVYRSLEGLEHLDKVWFSEFGWTKRDSTAN